MGSVGKDEGQLKGGGGPEKFGPPGAGDGVGGRTDIDIGGSGFRTSGYLDKRGTPYGEAARLNNMPPGMDIGNQVMTEQNPMQLKTVTASGYPGDGGFGSS